MNTKAFYLSKTLWINLLAIIAIVIQSRTGYVMPPEIQVTIYALINLVLRATTGKVIDFGGKTLVK